MNSKNVRDYFAKYPERAVMCGIWWWSLKQWLATQGLPIGSTDDPAVRERSEALEPDEMERVRNALKHLSDYVGQYCDGYWPDPEDAAIHLNAYDPDVFTNSRL